MRLKNSATVVILFIESRSCMKRVAVDALVDIIREKPNYKNRTCNTIEQAIIDYAIMNLAHGQKCVSDELMKKGILVPSSTVRTIWLSFDLNKKEKRLRSCPKTPNLQSHLFETGYLLT